MVAATSLPRRQNYPQQFLMCLQGWDNSSNPTLLPGKLNLIDANTATKRLVDKHEHSLQGATMTVMR